jgi:hypothetical protein
MLLQQPIMRTFGPVTVQVSPAFHMETYSFH